MAGHASMTPVRPKSLEAKIRSPYKILEGWASAIIACPDWIATVSKWSSGQVANQTTPWGLVHVANWSPESTALDQQSRARVTSFFLGPKMLRTLVCFLTVFWDGHNVLPHNDRLKPRQLDPTSSLELPIAAFLSGAHWTLWENYLKASCEDLYSMRTENWMNW